MPVDRLTQPPNFQELGITDICSRCGRPYDEHPHAPEEDCVIPNPHAFRTQPVGRRFLWPDGMFPSW